LWLLPLVLSASDIPVKQPTDAERIEVLLKQKAMLESQLRIQTAAVQVLQSQLAIAQPSQDFSASYGALKSKYGCELDERLMCLIPSKATAMPPGGNKR